jgi:hypothetical protein
MVIECMAGKWLQHLAESCGMLNPDQSSFRPQQLTEDQVIRLSQAIGNGFQAKKPANWTVLALLEFLKAYHKVWRAYLLTSNVEEGSPGLLCMVDPGIPVQ